MNIPPLLSAQIYPMYLSLFFILHCVYTYTMNATRIIKKITNTYTDMPADHWSGTSQDTYLQKRSRKETDCLINIPATLCFGIVVYYSVKTMSVFLFIGLSRLFAP